MSFFLTFEGIDGCGKSTQLQLLHQRLQAAGLAVLATREPGGTALAEGIREQILHSPSPLTPIAELLLFGAARAQHVSEVIRPALDSGTIVLSDRFADSSLAYQGGGGGQSEVFITNVNDEACAGLQPDLTVLLDLDPEVAAARRGAGRAAAEDRIEQRGAEFQRRVRASYLNLANKQPKRIFVLDAARPVDEVFGAMEARLICHPLWPQYAQ